MSISKVLKKRSPNLKDLRIDFTIVPCKMQLIDFFLSKKCTFLEFTYKRCRFVQNQSKSINFSAIHRISIENQMKKKSKKKKISIRCHVNKRNKNCFCISGSEFTTPGGSIMHFSLKSPSFTITKLTTEPPSLSLVLFTMMANYLLFCCFAAE